MYIAQSHEAIKNFKIEVAFLNFVPLWLCARQAFLCLFTIAAWVEAHEQIIADALHGTKL